MLERQRGEKDLLPLFSKRKLGATTTMPLSGGLLTGKYNNKTPDGSRYSKFQTQLRKFLSVEQQDLIIEKVKKISEISNAINVSMSQLAIAWCLKNHNVSSVITGVSNEQQLLENLKSISVIEALSNDVMENIDSIMGNKPVYFVANDVLFDYDMITELV